LILLHQDCLLYNKSLLQRHTSCPTYFQGDKPNQLDTKDLPPAQGRNPSLNGRFHHQEAVFSLMKIDKGSWIFRNQNWQRTGCHQEAGSSLIKIGKWRIRDLTGDACFPEVDISNKRLPASSWNTHQLLQYVPPTYGQSFNLKIKRQVSGLFHQDERLASVVYCNANRKQVSIKSKKVECYVKILWAKLSSYAFKTDFS